MTKAKESYLKRDRFHLFCTDPMQYNVEPSRVLCSLETFLLSLSRIACDFDSKEELLIQFETLSHIGREIVCTEGYK
jgi:hypothetical protein